jgi:hypothetical protein
MQKTKSTNNEIAFLVSRNINTQSGALMLILNRSISLRDDFNINSHFINLSDVGSEGACTLSKNGFSVRRISTYKYNLIYLFIGFIRMFLATVSYLRRQPASVIVISGYFPVIFIGLLKLIFSRTRILLDVHGAVEEMLEYPSDKLRIFNSFKFIYLFLKLNLFWTLKLIDGVLVVSNTLHEHLVKFHGLDINKKSFFIPCTSSNTNGYLANRNQSRNSVVKKLSISDKCILFVYSGGTSKWQCLNETLEYFCKINKGLLSESSHLMLILSDRQYKIPKKYLHLPITLMTLSPNEIPEFLMAADFSFLIRDHSITNKVAFPNKFYEYFAYGTKCIITDAIFDIRKIVCDEHQGIVLSNEMPINYLLDYINRSKDFDPYETTYRRDSVSQLSMKSTLMLFSKYISADSNF